MKRVLKYLLFVVFCTMCLWGKQVNAADTSEVQVELTGVKDVKIYTDKVRKKSSSVIISEGGFYMLYSKH